MEEIINVLAEEKFDYCLINQVYLVDEDKLEINISPSSIGLLNISYCSAHMSIRYTDNFKEILSTLESPVMLKVIRGTYNYRQCEISVCVKASDVLYGLDYIEIDMTVIGKVDCNEL